MIELTSETWVDLYQLTGISAGTKLLVQNQSRDGVAMLYAGASPPSGGADGFLLGSRPAETGAIFFDPKGTLKLYARAFQGDPSLYVMDAGVLSPNGVNLMNFGIYRATPTGETSRLKTEMLTLAQQYILDGLGFFLSWIEDAIPSGQRRFAEITVPAGFYFAIGHREIITDKERCFYRSYAQTDYTGFTPTTPIIARNLRADAITTSYSTIATKGTLSSPPSATLARTVIPVFGAVGAGNRASGDVGNDAVFRLYPPGVKVLTELFNASADPMYAQVDADFTLIPASMVQAALA